MGHGGGRWGRWWREVVARASGRKEREGPSGHIGGVGGRGRADEFVATGALVVEIHGHTVGHESVSTLGVEPIAVTILGDVCC